MPLTNCETELGLRRLRRLKKYITSEIYNTPEKSSSLVADPPTNHVPPTLTTTAILQINNVKLYVPVVTLPINNNIKFLENIKQGFKRTISWNKYRYEITAQPKNNNLYYMIDPTFRNIHMLFVLSF